MRTSGVAAALLGAMGATGATGGGIGGRFSNISSELERSLLDAFERAHFDYSEPRLNATYLSSTAFNPMGMGHLYNLTAAFVDLVQKKQAFPDDLLEVHEGQIEMKGEITDRWQDITKHYIGIIIIVVLGLLLGLLLPIVGFFFCCCRCAGKCGGRTQPFDKKHDKCRKRMLATFLICIATLFMLGLVSTFVTNERIREGVHGLPDAVRHSLSDVQTFLNVTHDQIDTLLKTNYEELSRGLNIILDTGGATISKQLGEFSKAVSVTTLNTMVKDLKDVKRNLGNMKSVTNQLRANASQLNDGLRKVKRELLTTLMGCTDTECKKILQKYKVGELDTSGIDFNQLPDVTDILNKVDSLLNGSIEEDVSKGQKVFENLQKDIESSVEKEIPKLRSAIEKAGVKINNFSSKFEKIVKDAYSELDSVKPNINHGEAYIREYTIYGWYVGFGLCCVLLLILVCIVMGLLCGICGKRPDGYGDDCCNKGAGSKFLMSGVTFMFLLGLFLILITLVYFLVGVVAQRGVCDPLKNPEDDQLFELMDKMVNLHKIIFKNDQKNDFNLSYVITACHKNKTVYDVLKLDKLINIQALQEQSEKEIAARIKEIHDTVNFIPTSTTILNEGAINNLKELSESGLSDFPFDRFTEVLVTNVTSIDLLSLANQLRDTASKISKRPPYTSIVSDLKNQALHLESYQHNLVNPMIREVEMLNDTAVQLRDGLKFNHSSFKDAILNLIDETKEASEYLSREGPEAIKNFTMKFATNIGSIVNEYLSRVSNHTRNEVGHCGPLSNVYNATLTATCGRILYPLNGFWFAAGCCIILFIPLIILSAKLATLYRKSDPYPGTLVEAEYLYDAYADRDNIPLANSHNVEKMGGHGRRRGDRNDRSDRGAGRSNARPRSGDNEPRAPMPDGSHPTRYNDMAPKHWEDFPAGGPPQYRGPAEYERPPPYYYPGPHDRS